LNSKLIDIRKKRRKGGNRSSLISRYAQRTVNPEYYSRITVSENIISGTVTSESIVASSGVTAVSDSNWILDDDIYRRRILTERYRPEPRELKSGYLWAPYIPLTVTGPLIASGVTHHHETIIRREYTAKRERRIFSFSG